VTRGEIIRVSRPIKSIGAFVAYNLSRRGHFFCSFIFNIHERMKDG
jgi:hypothetical protein